MLQSHLGITALTFVNLYPAYHVLVLYFHLPRLFLYQIQAMASCCTLPQQGFILHHSLLSPILVPCFLSSCLLNNLLFSSPPFQPLIGFSFLLSLCLPHFPYILSLQLSLSFFVLGFHQPLYLRSYFGKLILLE